MVFKGLVGTPTTITSPFLHHMSSTDEVEATALVSRGPVSAGGWNLEKVTLRPLKEDEVLVRVVGSGICLGDLHVGDAAPGDDDSALDSVVYYPRVLGHEGENAPVHVLQRIVKRWF